MTITRLWQTGFESDDEREADSGVYVITSTGSRTGTRSGSCLITAPNRYLRKSVPGSLQQRTGFNNYMVLPTADAEIVTVRHAAGELFNVNYEPGGDLSLEVAGTRQDLTTNSPIQESVHHHFGIDFKIDGVAGWIEVYLNQSSTPVLSFSGNTGSSNVVTYDYGTYQDAGNIGFWYFDDIYIDDTVGEGSATLPPLLRFYRATLDGNGNYNDWLGSDGNSVDNYLLVDQIGTSDSEYIEVASGVMSDSWTTTSISLEPGQTIQAFIPLIKAQRFGDGETIKIGSRLSSTDLTGSEQSPDFGAYNYLWERQTTKPGGGAWSESDINSVEILVVSSGIFL